MIGALSGKRFVFQWKPQSGLALVDKKRFTWSVTDDDPHLILVHRFGRGLPSGYYKISILNGRYVNRLTSASFYFDSGRGFNESERQAVNFREEGNQWVAYLFVKANSRRIRFDPVEDRRLVFSGRGVLFEAIGQSEYESSLALIRTSREFRPEREHALNILVNLFRLLPAHSGAGGAGRLALAYLRHLPSLVNLRVIISKSNESLVPEYPEVDFAVCDSESAAEFEKHFNWCHCYFDFLNGLRPTYIPSEVIVVACLLDLQHMRMPMLFSKAELSGRMREYGYAIDRADRLIAISDYERENLYHFYGKENVSVVPLSGFAAEDYLEDHQRRASWSKPHSQAYLVYPAVPWSHKNHETLVQAIAFLKKTGRHVRLVLTNTDSHPENKKKLIRLCQMFDLSDVVELKGFISEPELIELMRRSSGMVFPSLYEGFGIPLVDALKLGVPILASRIATIEEICGASASYFRNHRNAISMADDIWRFWCAAGERSQLIAAGRERGRAFSSRRMAEGLVDAARLALVNKGRNAGPYTISPAGEPEKGLLSILVFLARSDIDGDSDLVASLESFSRALGAAVEVTAALDIRDIGDAEAQSFMKYPRLILFHDYSARSRVAAVEEFARRYNSSDFHMVIEWSDRERFCLPQLLVMIRGLRLYPAAEYAVVDPEISDLAYGDSTSEEKIVNRFEGLRTLDRVIGQVMFRSDGAFRGLHHGTVQFLSAYCVEDNFLRVPRVGTH